MAVTTIVPRCLDEEGRDELQIGRWRIKFPGLRHRQKMEIIDTIDGSQPVLATQGRACYVALPDESIGEQVRADDIGSQRQP